MLEMFWRLEPWLVSTVNVLNTIELFVLFHFREGGRENRGGKKGGWKGQKKGEPEEKAISLYS